jgi:hypothetical protein
VGAKVVTTSNVAQHYGLCNGTTGIVKDIVYDEQKQYGHGGDDDSEQEDDNVAMLDENDEITSAQPPAYPSMCGLMSAMITRVLSSFQIMKSVADGCRFIPSRQVKLHHQEKPMERQRNMNGPCCRSDLLGPGPSGKLKGKKFTTKIVLNLGSHEREHGLTYVGFSRATRLSLIGIQGGFTLERFTTKIKNHFKMAPRIKEEKQLHALAEATLQNIDHFRAKRFDLEQRQATGGTTGAAAAAAATTNR